MKINNKFFSIPPYISTGWNNIQALHMKGNTLVATLVGGDTINIPGLSAETIESIFTAHTAYLESDTSQAAGNSNIQQADIAPIRIMNPFVQQMLSGEQGTHNPFRFGFTTPEGFSTALEHNPEQAEAPDLPKEILEKIGAIAKIVTPEEIAAMPKPEPHCNCIHCQLTRAISSAHQAQTEEKTFLDVYGGTAAPELEEAVSDEELNFQQWEISQTGDKLFAVTNKLDTKEKYSVYLGHPVGCTCGKAGCEHILAVLKS